VPFTDQALAALKRILIVFAIALAFTVGVFGAIYLSLRSSETRVPDIVGKDRMAAEDTISSAGLNFRVRATRPTSEAKANTVIFQLPRAGEVVKVGQTVAVDISRATNGESAPTPDTNSNTNTNTNTEDKNKNAANSRANANSNENKPKKKPANKNDNANANGNANRAANQNRNANANRPTPANANTNANRTATPAHSNVNSNAPKGNTNGNRRAPAAAPTP
jgi:hypothetical protein